MEFSFCFETGSHCITPVVLELCVDLAGLQLDLPALPPECMDLSVYILLSLINIFLKSFLNSFILLQRSEHMDNDY